MTDNNNNINTTDASVSEIQNKLEKTTISPTDNNPPNPTENVNIQPPINQNQQAEETKVEDTTQTLTQNNPVINNTTPIQQPPLQTNNITINNVQQQVVQNQVPQVQTIPPQIQQIQQIHQVVQPPPQQVQQQVTPQQVQQTQGKDDDDLTNLIINYLPPTMSEGTLATLFSPYGLLERCKIVVDLQTLRSRGYGFVKYDNAVSAERALTALNGYELNGKKLKVAFARPQCKAITNANLYITNVPPHYTDNNLRKLFCDYGKIVECRVLMDQNGQSRGVGFVRMDTHHNAIQALQAMDQYVIDDKHPPLLVKLAQRRVPRRYWNSQGGRNQNQQGNRGGNRGQQMGGPQGPNKNKNKRNSPNRKYYPKGGYRDNMGGGGMGIGQGQGQNRQSPNKRGYYRPRQSGGNRQGGNMGGRKQGGMGGGGSGGGGSGGSGQGNNNNNNNQGGPPYFPAPMYQQEPYGMASYGQPTQYTANIHMSAAINNPSNPSNNIESSQHANQPASYNVLVFNLPKHFNVDHIINMYAKFGPVQSVNIRDEISSFPKKGPVGIISYFYFDDAQRAQNETNQLEVGSNGDVCRLETMFQPPLK